MQNNDTTQRENFGIHLREIRESKNLSQKNIAEKLHCAVSTYANWEQGRREPSIKDIFNLMKALEIDANQLFNL